MADTEELEALEHADEWDFDRAGRRPGVEQARAIVSVAFQRQDFERLTRCADQLHMRTSAFIRAAALEKADCHRQRTRLTGFSASAGVTLYSPTPLAITRLTGSAIQLGDKGASY
jgi:hypothetical protein